MWKERNKQRGLEWHALLAAISGRTQFEYKCRNRQAKYVGVLGLRTK